MELQGLGLSLFLLAIDGLELDVTGRDISEYRCGERRGYARSIHASHLYLGVGLKRAV
jgi:hypothetical protein